VFFLDILFYRQRRNSLWLRKIKAVRKTPESEFAGVGCKKQLGAVPKGPAVIASEAKQSHYIK
jgi:hypothetical protein